MNYKDYYKTLGVSKSASKKEIQDAFRKLARQYHPDRNKGNKQAEEKFKDINEAYQVLSDSQKRQKYDQFGAQWGQYSRGGGRPEDFDWGRWTAGPGGSGRTVSAEDLQDILGGLGGMGGFSDFFETLFGGGLGRGQVRGGQPRQVRGRDVEHEVEITLEEAYNGATRVLQRSGGGRGEVRIPKGVRTGSKVRLSGAGAQAGDLYLKIKVLPHFTFKREKDTLRVNIPVDLYTAILGGEIAVPTLKRTAHLTIPPHTANGRTFRLRGLGMPLLKSPDKYGDLLAKVDVQLPKKLSEQEKQLFEQLRALQGKA